MDSTSSPQVDEVDYLVAAKEAMDQRRAILQELRLMDSAPFISMSTVDARLKEADNLCLVAVAYASVAHADELRKARLGQP